MSEKRANLLNVREVRGLVSADTSSPTGLVGVDWSELVSLRADADDPEFWSYRGEASIVDHPYTVRDMWGEFEETIVRGAFDKTLSENPDVMLNYMHEPATTMVTTRSGGLTLSAGPHLLVDARVPKSDLDAQRVMPKVARGDAVSMSFAFRVTRQEWNDDYTERFITEVNLHRGDVAVIVSGLGANPAAWGTVRADIDADQILAWLATADPEARSAIAATLAPAPEITEPDPDEVRAWLEMKARADARVRAERDRLAGIGF
jgi:HK97 family phage prohead protease